MGAKPALPRAVRSHHATDATALGRLNTVPGARGVCPAGGSYRTVGRGMELHRLPASIELTLEEARALYLAIGAVLDEIQSYDLRAAFRMLGRKLWPELGELPEEDS